LIAGTTWASEEFGSIAPATRTAKARALERSRMFAAREIKCMILRCLEILESQGKVSPFCSLIQAFISLRMVQTIMLSKRSIQSFLTSNLIGYKCNVSCSASTQYDA
jgi:hypothetical protein